jgi:hypothetical protein
MPVRSAMAAAMVGWRLNRILSGPSGRARKFSQPRAIMSETTIWFTSVMALARVPMRVPTRCIVAHAMRPATGENPPKPS